ncbi:MAG: hypothetical protein AAGI53_04285 [Planctomycetota bacterium]
MEHFAILLKVMMVRWPKKSSGIDPPHFGWLIGCFAFGLAACEQSGGVGRTSRDGLPHVCFVDTPIDWKNGGGQVLLSHPSNEVLLRVRSYEDQISWGNSIFHAQISSKLDVSFLQADGEWLRTTKMRGDSSDTLASAERLGLRSVVPADELGRRANRTDRGGLNLRDIDADGLPDEVRVWSIYYDIDVAANRVGDESRRSPSLGATWGMSKLFRCWGSIGSGENLSESCFGTLNCDEKEYQRFALGDDRGLIVVIPSRGESWTFGINSIGIVSRVSGVVFNHVQVGGVGEWSHVAYVGLDGFGPFCERVGLSRIYTASELSAAGDALRERPVVLGDEDLDGLFDWADVPTLGRFELFYTCRVR